MPTVTPGQGQPASNHSKRNTQQVISTAEAPRAAALSTIVAEPRWVATETGFNFPVAPDSFGYRIAKRAMDILGGCCALLLFGPIMLTAAVLVKLQDGGRVIFVQERVGRGGRLFKCLKFRTMVHNAEAIQHTILELNHHRDPRTFKVKRDPRITRVGHYLRRLSIDEFPQLWNVIRGDMSLVGPRPPLPQEVSQYTELDIQRLEVKPGLTCLWQISGRGDLPFDKQILLDIEYIENRGVWYDMRLILRTIPVILTSKGAY
ncbi:MAG: sugar transferase [Planctomycetales bacterium]|nr:sugar transferase [Planctomycetales bacterium]